MCLTSTQLFWHSGFLREMPPECICAMIPVKSFLTAATIWGCQSGILFSSPTKAVRIWSLWIASSWEKQLTCNECFIQQIPSRLCCQSAFLSTKAVINFHSLMNWVKILKPVVLHLGSLALVRPNDPTLLQPDTFCRLASWLIKPEIRASWNSTLASFTTPCDQNTMSI